jgi:hypothetical protein
MELAAQWGVKDYPSPAGGCLLTLEAPSQRLKNYFAFAHDRVELDDLNVIRVGRHFYLDEGCFLVVGRNQEENAVLNQIKHPGDELLYVTNRPGPIGLLRGRAPLSDAHYLRAAAIVARYSDARDEADAEVGIFTDDWERVINVAPAAE